MQKHHICLVIFVTCFTAFVWGMPISEDSKQEAAKTKSCKELCGHCGCQGFYCGDECICECNNQDDEDMTCVTTMQENCEKLKLPFEVLIQGPTNNRFVRSILETEANSDEFCLKKIDPDSKQRSTISIYKPDHTSQNIEILFNPVRTDESTEFVDTVKVKRSLPSDTMFENGQFALDIDPELAIGINENKVTDASKRQAYEKLLKHTELQENELYGNDQVLKRVVKNVIEDVALAEAVELAKAPLLLKSLIDEAILGVSPFFDSLKLGAGLDGGLFKEKVLGFDIGKHLFKGVDLVGLGLPELFKLDDLLVPDLKLGLADGLFGIDTKILGEKLALRTGEILGAISGGTAAHVFDFDLKAALDDIVERGKIAALDTGKLLGFLAPV